MAAQIPEIVQQTTLDRFELRSRPEVDEMGFWLPYFGYRIFESDDTAINLRKFVFNAFR